MSDLDDLTTPTEPNPLSAACDPEWMSPEEEASWREEREAEAEAAVRDSSTTAYIAFYQAREVITGTLEMLSALSGFHERRLQRDHAAIEQEDWVIQSHLDQQVAEEGQAIATATQIVLDAQRNLTFANLYNALESYVIDACKALLLTYPQEVKIQAKATVTYAELAEHLADPQALADVLLSQLLGESDREFSLDSVRPHLDAYLKPFDPDYLLLDESNALKRAGLIRHKITHRYGQVDRAFLRAMADPNLWTAGALPTTAYQDVGRQYEGLQPGQRYQVTPAELTQLVALTDLVARKIDVLLCVHYGQLISHDPLDFVQEFEDLRHGLAALTRLDRPE